MPTQAKVFPSVLAADFSCLEREIRDLEPHVDGFHLDVMDGVFVPNLSFGPLVVEAIRRLTHLPLHCHLMIVDPHRYVATFRNAGADAIFVHVETLPSPAETLAHIRSCGAAPGITLNPSTPFEAVLGWLSWVDHLLIMSVNPGFGGQPFMDEAIPRVEQAAQHRSAQRLGFAISVDGGVGPSNAVALRSAGADILVAGTSVFKASDRKRAVAQLRGSEVPAGP